MGWRWRRLASSLVLAVLVLTPAARMICAIACEQPGPGPETATAAAVPVAHANGHAHGHAHHASPPAPAADRSCAPAPLRPCDPQPAATLSATLAAARSTDAPPGTSAVPAYAVAVDARVFGPAIPRLRRGPPDGPPRAPLPLRI
jgi:hypothetical protein